MSVILSTDLKSKNQHRQVGVGKVMILGGVMVRRLALNAIIVGSIPALDTTFLIPISISPYNSFKPLGLNYSPPPSKYALQVLKVSHLDILDVLALRGLSIQFHLHFEGGALLSQLASLIVQLTQHGFLFLQQLVLIKMLVAD